MAKNEPIKQQYIPRSYLKNFGVEGNNGNYFVDAYRLEDDLLLEQISTKSICFQKNLYTIPNAEIDRKYDLEYHFCCFAHRLHNWLCPRFWFIILV